jgi:hypothetical protein
MPSYSTGATALPEAARASHRATLRRFNRRSRSVRRDDRDRPDRRGEGAVIWRHHGPALAADVADGKDARQGEGGDIHSSNLRIIAFHRNFLRHLPRHDLELGLVNQTKFKQLAARSAPTFGCGMTLKMFRP